jgi:hypothetical protein
MKITDFKTYYICPDHNEKYNIRKKHLDSLLSSLGFKDVIHYKSSSKAYPDCLSEATIDILENNLDNPVLILEDDIEWTGITEIEYNPDCDAIYFGLSRSGGHPTQNIHQGESKFENWSNTQVRVLNMLSGHAILYISRKYKEVIINVLKKHIGQKYYNDVLFSRIQKDFIILANKKPIFYQSSKFNRTDHEEKWTNFCLT